MHYICATIYRDLFPPNNNYSHSRVSVNIFECIDACACVIWLEKCINHKCITKITLMQGVNIGNLCQFFFYSAHSHTQMYIGPITSFLQVCVQSVVWH